MRWEWLVPLPPSGLGGNAREHWARTHNLKDQYRMEVAAEVLSRQHPDKPLTSARLTIQARICHRRVTAASPLRSQGRYRPTDLDNLISAMKSGIDALQPGVVMRGYAGVIAGDASGELELLILPTRRVDTFSEECVRLILEKL